MGYLKNKNLRVGWQFLTRGRGMGWLGIAKKIEEGGGGGRVIYKPPEHLGNI